MQKILRRYTNFLGGYKMSKKCKDNGCSCSNPTTGNTKGHISSKAGIKDPDAK